MNPSRNRLQSGGKAVRGLIALALVGLLTNHEAIAQNFWVQTNLTNTEHRALVITANEDIFAATGSGGALRSMNNGDSWTVVNIGLTNTIVFALVINSSEDIFAGTSGGVFRSTNNGDSWTPVNTGLTNTDVRALAINLNLTSGHIFAGTLRGGVFRSTNNGDSWTAVNTGLANTDVRALAINLTSGHIFSGTFGGGVFRSTNNGDSWTAVNTGLADTSVIALALNASGHIFAGTFGGGVFRSTNNGDSWTAVNTDLTNTFVSVFAINASGHIFAGTNGGVFRSTNNGDSWTAVNTGLANAGVLALAINKSGFIFAGTFGAGVFRSVESTTNRPPMVANAIPNQTIPVGGASFTRDLKASPAVFSDPDGDALSYTAISSATNIATANIPAGSSTLTVSPVSAGNATITVTANDSKGGTQFTTFTVTINSRTYPSTLSLNTPVNFPSRANASDYPATDYRIIGIPGASNQLVTTFLSLSAAQNNKDWQVYWDNGAASNFFVAFDGSANFQFSVGRAFWVINKGTLSISTTVPSAPLNTAQEIELPLPNSGWNLITNPFTASVAWSKIQSANNVTELIYAFTGSFSTATSFDPYSGYYFFNATNLSKLKIPYALYFSSTPAAEVDPAIWRVNIAFASGEFSDRSTSFGIASAASSDLDRFDFRKPRAITTMPTVEFKRPQWDVSYNTFATDIRPEFEDAESWEFDVRAISRQPAQLTFAGISKIPRQFEVYLLDTDHAHSVNLREDSLYHFTPAAELMKFKVVVGRKEKVQEQLSALALPKEFALGPNYPNPFNRSTERSRQSPATTIPIAVPVASEIKLKIYNLLGAEVKTIYAGSIEAGRYWFNWDGRNELGNNVAAGVYLFRLTTNKKVSLLGKMILIR